MISICWILDVWRIEMIFAIRSSERNDNNMITIKSSMCLPLQCSLHALKSCWDGFEMSTKFLLQSLSGRFHLRTDSCNIVVLCYWAIVFVTGRWFWRLFRLSKWWYGFTHTIFIFYFSIFNLILIFFCGLIEVMVCSTVYRHVYFIFHIKQFWSHLMISWMIYSNIIRTKSILLSWRQILAVSSRQTNGVPFCPTKFAFG